MTSSDTIDYVIELHNYLQGHPDRLLRVFRWEVWRTGPLNRVTWIAVAYLHGEEIGRGAAPAVKGLGGAKAIASRAALQHLGVEHGAQDTGNTAHQQGVMTPEEMGEGGDAVELVNGEETTEGRRVVDSDDEAVEMEDVVGYDDDI